LYVDIDVVVIL